MSDEEVWAGDRVQRWLRQADGLERQLASVADVLFEAAAIKPGERVLDVGCGTGPTTRRAAELVGRDGGVTGVDISADMVEAGAGALAASADAASTVWVVADVGVWEAPVATFDVVLSRFGVMFFTDPVAAFSNLAAGCRGGGRLAVAVWAPRDDSPLFQVPLHAAAAALRSEGRIVVLPPDDEGPFSLGDPMATTALLERSGWRGVHIVTHDLAMPFGGGFNPKAAALAALDFGPTRLITAGIAGPLRAAALRSIEGAFRDHLDDAGHVVLTGRVHVVTATR